MLNLRRPVVEEFWKSRDPRLLRILNQMKYTEYWTLDDEPDAMKALNAMSDRLMGASAERILDDLDNLISVLAYFSSAQAIRAVEWLDETYPSEHMAEQLLQRARQRPDDPKAQLMVERLQTLHRSHVLNQVFSPERLAVVGRLLRKTRPDRGDDLTS